MVRHDLLFVCNLGLRKFREGCVIMAGWDGDALAGSMEEALERQQQAAEERRARKDTASHDERERKVKEESLRLSRARIEEQLGRATNPAHRAMLERALKALDAEMTSSAAPE
jgi:hypothetical protein